MGERVDTFWCCGEYRLNIAIRILWLDCHRREVCNNNNNGVRNSIEWGRFDSFSCCSPSRAFQHFCIKGGYSKGSKRLCRVGWIVLDTLQVENLVFPSTELNNLFFPPSKTFRLFHLIKTWQHFFSFLLFLYHITGYPPLSFHLHSLVRSKQYLSHQTQHHFYLNQIIIKNTTSSTPRASISPLLNLYSIYNNTPNIPINPFPPINNLLIATHVHFWLIQRGFTYPPQFFFPSFSVTHTHTPLK